VVRGAAWLPGADGTVRRINLVSGLFVRIKKQAMAGGD